MNRLTILKSTGCDVKRLPLSVREAYLLSQLDGSVTLEEIAEISGFELDETLRVAELLEKLGAVSTMDSSRPTSSGPGRGRPAATEREGRVVRDDPRAEREWGPTPSSGKPRSLTAEVPKKPVAPPTQRTSPPPPRPERRRSRKSLAAQSAVRPQTEKDTATDLDEATIAKIIDLDLKLAKVDHYELLEVGRDADKKVIKRAYFRLAGTFHPDRFFGKRLGSAKAPVERIFHRITEANDTLTNADLRAAYDAKLPKRPPSRRDIAAVRKASRAMKAVSRQLQATVEPAPVTAIPKRRESKSLPAADQRRSSSPPTPRSPSPSPSPSPKPQAEGGEAAKSSTGDSLERPGRLRAAVLELQIQANVDRLVKAAEEALSANDLVGAANNYRLALSHRDDLSVRMKYDAINARACTVRFDKNIVPARSAERDQRWADAAFFLLRAYEAKADADVAARAANALRLGGGDLERAVTLAEQAVKLDGKNVGYRVTLAEVYLAANRLESAEEAYQAVVTLAPKDVRAKELAAAIAQKTKSPARRA